MFCQSTSAVSYLLNFDVQNCSKLCKTNTVMNSAVSGLYTLSLYEETCTITVVEFQYARIACASSWGMRECSYVYGCGKNYCTLALS